MSDPEAELEAAVADIRDEYARRAVAPQCVGSYSFLNGAHAELVFDREVGILRALGRHLGRPLAETSVLDVGAGTGISLALLAAYGVDTRRLAGVDIDAERIEHGRSQFPTFDLRTTNGHELPYEDDSFDVVQQITMLSSVYSPELRLAIAREMLRVTRPGGLIVSFDIAETPLLPRLVNRALSLGRRRPAAAAAAEASPAVRLTPVVPMGDDELRGLFAGATVLEIGRLMPYRPLVERSGPRLSAVLRALPGLGMALLFVARKPDA